MSHGQLRTALFPRCPKCPNDLNLIGQRYLSHLFHSPSYPKNFCSKGLLNIKQRTIHLSPTSSSPYKPFKSSESQKFSSNQCDQDYSQFTLAYFHQCRKRKDFHESSYAESPAPDPCKSRHLSTLVWMGSQSTCRYPGTMAMTHWKSPLSIEKFKFHYRLSLGEDEEFPLLKCCPLWPLLFCIFRLK